jgi:hypothetical protein
MLHSNHLTPQETNVLLHKVREVVRIKQLRHIANQYFHRGVRGAKNEIKSAFSAVNEQEKSPEAETSGRQKISYCGLIATKNPRRLNRLVISFSLSYFGLASP